MILSALNFITEEINLYYQNPITPHTDGFVQLGNIARLDNDPSEGLKTKVILSLVNLDEEKTLKNGPFQVKQGASMVKRNPTVYLNLFTLFSCANEDYRYALTQIGCVIEFFQQQYVFTAENSTQFPEDIEKLIFDLHSVNIEQLNHLWGILGGKYVPSVLYKLRLVPIQKSKGEEGPLIRDITANANIN